MDTQPTQGAVASHPHDTNHHDGAPMSHATNNNLSCGSHSEGNKESVDRGGGAMLAQSQVVSILQQQLAQHATQHEKNEASVNDLLDILCRFCAVKQSLDSGSEYKMLCLHPELLGFADVLENTAIAVNALNDSFTAFTLHRKAQTLFSCKEFGVDNFYDSLDAQNHNNLYFLRVGPPPGYTEDFYKRLAKMYYQGDTLLCNQKATHPNNSVKSSTPAYSNPSVNSLAEEWQRLKQKYSDEYYTKMSNQKNTLYKQQVNSRKDRSIINEFVHTHQGVKKLLSWFSMIPAFNQFKLLELAKAQSYSENMFHILTKAQRELIVPELIDVQLLCSNDAHLLFELVIKLATGVENDFSSHAEKEALNAVQKDHAHLETEKMDYEGVINWFQSKKHQYFAFVSAILFLEFEQEKYTVSKLQNVKIRKILKNQGHYKDFEFPFLQYRTRRLQLFILHIIQKCLTECIPKRGRDKKKKKDFKAKLTINFSLATTT